MRSVSANELQSWLSDGKILEEDSRGPKVVALPCGRFLKIFHTRRHRLLARLQPAALRFARNAERLRTLNIRAPEVLESFWLDRKAGLSACLYRPLPGESVEQLYRQAPHSIRQLLPSLADFIRQLHELGVYFRSLHLGNIIRMPDGRFGLIDILDLRCRNHALNTWQIQRNFHHLLRYLDRQQLPGFPLDTLQELYRRSVHSS